MKKLYLHIGASKTGTTAIQAWLANNVQQLYELGYSYDLTYAPKKLLSSGNGALFVQFCSESRRTAQFDEAQFKEYIHAQLFQGKHVAIVSSEALSFVREDGVRRLKDELDRQGIEAKVILYVRSIYDHCWSAYQQGVKRHGEWRDFADYAETYVNHQVKAAQSWSAVFADLNVVNYDHVQDRLIGSFSEIIRIPDGIDLPSPKGVVNRSMTQSELTALRVFNKCLGEANAKDFGRKISDAMITSSPSKRSYFAYDAAVERILVAKFSEEVSWLNETFLKGMSTSVHSRSAKKSGVGTPVVDDCSIHKDDLAIALDAYLREYARLQRRERIEKQ